MSRTHLFVFLIAVCTGVAVGEVVAVPTIAPAAAAAGAIIICSIRRLRLAGVLMLGIVIGLTQTERQLRVAVNDVSRSVGQTITMTGNVVVPSSIDGTAQRFELTHVVFDKHLMQGKILISVPAIPVIHAGQNVQVTCLVTELTKTSLRRNWSHGIHARCATLHVDVVSQAHSWRATLGEWQEQLLMYVRHNMNEPQASLLNGILIGNTDGMPERLNQAFQATGTTHIVALSGFNVTIIMAIVVGWLIKSMGRRWAWMPALLLLIAFVVMSGASASVVRAAIMAVIVQLGLFIGRPVSIGRLLAYTALLMVLSNPLVLWHDLGCQLSFLATVGLVSLSKPIARALTWIPQRFGLRDNLATTLAAIVMTEPLLLWRFGRLSLVAPLVNIVVVPMIPLAMGLGAVFLLGMWMPFSVPIQAPVNDALLRLIIGSITYGASLPQAMIHLAPLVTTIMAMSFVMIAVYFATHYVQEDSSPLR